MGTLPVDDKKLNGRVPEFRCPVSDEWEQTRIEVLNHMDNANTQLGEIAKAIQDSNTNLLGPATGRRQIPLDVVLALIVFWGVYSVFMVAKDTHKNIKLNWSDGLQITDSK